MVKAHTRNRIAFILILGLILTGCGDKEAIEAAKAKKAVELKAQEDFTNYLSAFQSTTEGSDEERELRKEIIASVKLLASSPAIPDEVLKYEGRGEAAINSAQSPGDYLSAADEYKKALRLAPWIAPNYYNLGLVLEKAGELSESIDSFNLYLLTTPSAEDETLAKKKIAGLEYEIERLAKEKADEETRIAAAKAKKIEEMAADLLLAWDLEGVWAPRPFYMNTGVEVVTFCRMKIEIDDTNAEVVKIYTTCLGVPTTNAYASQFWYTATNLPYIEAVIEDGRLIGTKNQIWYSSDGNGISGTDPYDAEVRISYDKESFTAMESDGTETEWLKE